MSAPYGLIFDVDGVIADSEKVNAEVSIKVFADLFGLDNVRRKDFEAGLGRGAEEYMKAAASVHGLQLTAQQVAEATQARQERFLKLLKEEPLQPFPGVLELINAALADDRFRAAIATSSTREKSEALLQSARVPYRQMVYIAGDQVRSKKPDPELFLVAAQGINVPPRNCVVVEDAPNGIQAAHAAGCKCIAVTNSAPAAKLAEADLIVSALTQVGLDDIIGMLRGRGA